MLHFTCGHFIFLKSKNAICEMYGLWILSICVCTKNLQKCMFFLSSTINPGRYIPFPAGLTFYPAHGHKHINLLFYVEIILTQQVTFLYVN